jgi:hypothetical protein
VIEPTPAPEIEPTPSPFEVNSFSSRPTFV